MAPARTFLTAFVLLAFFASVVQAQTTIETVPVGNVGNDPDDTGYGSVGYEYWMGKYEVTNSQYCEFLNAVDWDGTNPYGLYSTEMESGYGGITFTDTNPSGSKYSVRSGRGNMPVNFVSWGDAARFTNWLHNGRPNTGVQDLTTTENGSYYLNGATSNSALQAVTRDADATWVLPSEDEWYKAAYYDPDKAGYWDYPTQSDTAPTAEPPPGTDLVNGSANYNNAVGDLTDVGAYDTMSSVEYVSDSAYGTFDQGGNLWEWTERIVVSSRLVKGGTFDEQATKLHASHHTSWLEPQLEAYPVGLRVARNIVFKLNGAPILESELLVETTPLLAAGDEISGRGTLDAALTGQAGSAILVDDGNMTLGDPTSYAGFSTEGTIDIQPGNTLTLRAAGFAALGVSTTVDSGTLAAANGVALGVGDNLVGSGAVSGRIFAAGGSVIDASTGDITLGNADAYDGFYSDGVLLVNNHIVTIHDKNEAVLGSLTQIDSGGTLIAPNGFILQDGKNVIGPGGSGDSLVSKGDGPEGSRFLNRGYVEGPASESPDYLIFDLLFKASTGQTAGNLGFLGGYAPGDSPGWEQHDGNLLLGGTSPFEIGGPTPGDGDGYHSRLDVTGNLTFVEDAILEILPWGGYVPEPGFEFTILTWGGDLSGPYPTITYDPWFAGNGVNFQAVWNSNSLTLTPEPSSFVLLCMGVVGLLFCGWRKRRRH